MHGQSSRVLIIFLNLKSMKHSFTSLENLKNVSSFSIDATKDDGGLGRFVNDAVGKLENCVMKSERVAGTDRLCLFVKKDMKMDEELRYDYGLKDLPWRKVCFSKIIRPSIETRISHFSFTG